VGRLKAIKVKSVEEIMLRFRDLVRRHRRRFMQRNLTPCPNNCKLATLVGHRVSGCSGCGSRNPDNCMRRNKFVPIFTKDQLAEQFRRDVHDPQILLREYRDLVVFLWVIGHFDNNEQVDEQIISKVETYDKTQTESGDGDGSITVRGAGTSSEQRTGQGNSQPEGTDSSTGSGRAELSKVQGK
jgi:hypothetical protein